MNYKYKKIILFFTFLFFTFFTFAQESDFDTLEKRIRNEKIDSVKIKLLTKYVIKSFNSDLNRGLPYADSLLYYSKKNKDFNHISIAYRFIGNYYMNKGDFNKAIDIYSKSLKLSDSINYPPGQYADLANIGNAYRYDRKMDSAELFYKKALHVVINNKIKKKYTSAYQNLAGMYYNSNDHVDAINYFIKAIDSSIYLLTKEKIRIVPVYVNLGSLFLDQEDYKEATLYLKKGYDLSKKLKFKQGIADSGLKLARLYYENNKNFDESELLLKNCIKTYKELGDNMFLTNAYINLGNLYLVKKELNKSIMAKLKAIEIAKKNNLSDYYYGAITSVSKSYYKQSKYKKALKSINTILKDTSDVKMTNATKINLLDIKQKLAAINKNYRMAYFYSNQLMKERKKNNKILNNKAIKNIETKYQTEKKEKENLQLKADKATQELQLIKEAKQKQYFAFALLASLLTLGIFGFYYQQNKKQKAIIENLQKDLHHRVKNNLAIIDSLVEDIKDEFNNEKFILKLTDLQNRIDSINEVHQQLYQNTDITNLKFKKYVEKLANNVQHSFAKENIKINNNINDSFTLDVEKSFPIGLIINEFLTNSFKYAFTDKEKGIVNVDLKEKGVNYLLSLSDNGKGLPDDFDISKQDSFGVDVMQLLSKQLKGTFTLDGTNGVNLQIEFPKV